MDEIEKLKTAHDIACCAYLCASDTLDDARKARDAASADYTAASASASAASADRATAYAAASAASASYTTAYAASSAASADYKAAYSIRRKASESMLISARAYNKALNEAFEEDFLSE